MKAIVATLIAALSALATSGTTSSPLLDVERSDIVSIVAETPPLPTQVLRVDPVVDTTVVDTTVVDTTVVDTTVVDTTVVDATASTGSADCAAGGATSDQDASASTTTLGC